MAVQEARLLSQGTFPTTDVVEQQKSRTLAEGLPFKVQSWPKERQERKRKEKKPPMKVRSLNSKPGTDLLENSSDDESEDPVHSLNNGDSSITVRINEQRIKMIVDGRSKYDIISSELHKTQFKDYELSQTQKR